MPRASRWDFQKGPNHSIKQNKLEYRFLWFLFLQQGIAFMCIEVLMEPARNDEVIYIDFSFYLWWLDHFGQFHVALLLE